MAALTIRGQHDDELVRSLKRHAVEEGVSAEELHRRILAGRCPGPQRTGADLAAALRRIGELGLEIEPDRRWGGIEGADLTHHWPCLFDRNICYRRK